MLLIIPRAVWFRQITRGSWKIHRMDFWRVPCLSCLWFRLMAQRWNLWSKSSGSGGTAIFTKSSCPGLAPMVYHAVAKPDQDVLKLQLCTGEIRKPTTVEKCIGAAELEWAKEYGGILYNRWYLLDCHDTYTENPKRLLLRHGQYQNFWVYMDDIRTFE